MTTVQLIAIVVAAVFILQVMLFTSRHKLRDRYAFFWIIVALSGLVVAFTIPMFNRLTSWLGISYMPTFVFMIAFFIILSILIYQTSVLSTHQEHVKNIVQELAFLKKDLEDIKYSNSVKEETDRKMKVM